METKDWYGRFIVNIVVPHRIHNSLPLVLILSHMNPMHRLPPNFRKINVSVILPIMSMSSHLSISFRVYKNICKHFSFSHACYKNRLPHSTLFNLSQYLMKSTSMKPLILQLLQPFCHFILFFQTFFTAPCSLTPSMCVHLLLLDTISYTHTKHQAKLTFTLF
jgi:hypothetical protein